MNNSFLINTKEIKEKDELKDKELQKSVKIYESIQALKNVRDFSTLIELVFEEELNASLKAIQRNSRLLKDDFDNKIKNQMIYDEGRISVLKKIVDLSDLESRVKVVIDKLK